MRYSLNVTDIVNKLHSDLMEYITNSIDVGNSEIDLDGLVMYIIECAIEAANALKPGLVYPELSLVECEQYGLYSEVIENIAINIENDEIIYADKQGNILDNFLYMLPYNNYDGIKPIIEFIFINIPANYDNSLDLRLVNDKYLLKLDESFNRWSVCGSLLDIDTTIKTHASQSLKHLYIMYIDAIPNSNIINFKTFVENVIHSSRTLGSIVNLHTYYSSEYNKEEMLILNNLSKYITKEVIDGFNGWASNYLIKIKVTQ